MQAATLCYSGAAFGPRNPYFLVEKLESFPQLISNEVCDCIPNIQWICSHVFELGDLQLLGSTQFFNPCRGFPLITFPLGMLYCLFLRAWKAIDSLICVPNILFSDVYLSFLFNFKIGSL